QLFGQREDGEVARLDQVFSYCEDSPCFPQALVRYFGEEMDEACGTCQRCQGGEKERIPRHEAREFTLEEVETIRSLIDERHPSLRQPRQLTRFLCGITSPAASRARLGRHDQFGQFRDRAFEEVLSQVEVMVI
ncbi:MAG: RecQ family zinc-binding domain-containing protein, partial [Verrucomicrobiota bacterium]